VLKEPIFEYLILRSKLIEAIGKMLKIKIDEFK